VGRAYGGTKDQPLNVLDQLVKHGMIDEKKFGIYTQMKNETADPSKHS